MRWLTVAGVLLYLTRCNDAGVLKCHPGSEDPLCTLEKKEIITPVQNTIDRDSSSSSESDERQCLPGSQWESNCHACLCTELGYADCTPVLSCLAESLADPIPCRPNTTFKRYGDTCVCLENGQALCTLRHNIEKRSRAEDEQCTPGTHYTKECNSCLCLDDGKAACTKRQCLHFGELHSSEKKPLTDRLHKREIPDSSSSSNSRRVRGVPTTENKSCQPGTEFRMDCNKCLCDNTGMDFSCTRIDCDAAKRDVVDRSKRDTTTVEQQCVPGSVFERQCNVCRCTDDGQHAACTLKRCKEAETTTEPTPAFRCTPGDQYRQDCNDCTCSADGKNVFCTLRLCDPTTL